jgi:hypothetical protein
MPEPNPTNGSDFCFCTTHDWVMRLDCRLGERANLRVSRKQVRPTLENGDNRGRNSLEMAGSLVEEAKARGRLASRTAELGTLPRGRADRGNPATHG